jgi:hypothetical protein
MENPNINKDANLKTEKLLSSMAYDKPYDVKARCRYQSIQLKAPSMLT